MPLPGVARSIIALCAANGISLVCHSQPLASRTPLCAAMRSAADPSPIARFDALVAGALPATMDIPRFDGVPGSGKTSRLRIVSRLRSSVTFPGERPADLYNVTIDDIDAVVTRSDTGLDISLATNDGVHITSMNTDAPAIGHVHVPANTDPRGGSTRRSVSDSFEGDVEYPDEPPEPMPFADPGAPLTIRIFLHAELRWSKAREIHAGYVAWWVRDMESNVLPGQAFDIIYLQPMAGVSDKAYGDPHFLSTWNTTIDGYVRNNGLRRTWKNKYLLVTRDLPARGKLGQAIPERGVATASLSGPYSVIAHELGHLFGAEHAKAEWRLGTWWPCQTNMRTPDVSMLANCYEYSSANMENIRRYVDLKGYIPPRWLGRRGGAR